jgi:quinol monooxygenase YgiN
MAFQLEGAATEGTAILEFPSIEAAKAWYNSPVYRQRWLGKTKGELPMDSQKIYLLAEVTVLPEFLDDVKGALKQALVPTLQEPGCEGLFETSREGDPHKLVFFEIFSSSVAHKFHLEQDYMKRLFTALQGKLAGATIMTKLNAL